MTPEQRGPNSSTTRNPELLKKGKQFLDGLCENDRIALKKLFPLPEETFLEILGSYVDFAISSENGRITKYELHKLQPLNFIPNGKEHIANTIASLTGLEYLDITGLDFKGLYTQMLAGLKNLEHLDICPGYEFTDLKPLDALFLKSLTIGSTAVKDWMPLSKHTKMQELNLEENSNLDSLAFTTTMSELRTLNVRGAGIKHAEACRNHPHLIQFTAVGSLLEDLDGLSECSELSTLVCNESPIESADVVRKLLKLKLCHLRGSQIDTAKDFADHPSVENVDISETYVTSLQVFTTCPQLTTLNANGLDLDDISCLLEIDKLARVELRDVKFPDDQEWVIHWLREKGVKVGLSQGW